MSANGWMEVTFAMPCDLSHVHPTQQWIAALLRQNPDVTGWPFFVDLWNAQHPEFKPVIKDGIWEARVFQTTDEYDGGVDYWRIDARNGLFYAARAFEDDTSPRAPAHEQTLEFALVILRVAEVLAVAISFANYLCKDVCEENAAIAMSFKWTGLEGRALSAWASPGRSLSSNYVSNTDIQTLALDVPISSSPDEIAVLTARIVNELFLCFGGWSCPGKVVNDLVDNLMSRKLL